MAISQNVPLAFIQNHVEYIFFCKVWCAQNRRSHTFCEPFSFYHSVI